MSILYVIFHLGEVDELPEWLATFGIACPPGQSRFPTPNEVRATLDALEGYTIDYFEGTEDCEATVTNTTSPDRWPWTSVRTGKATSAAVADTPQPISFKSGSTELIVQICERLTHLCGPLIIYPDSGHEVPILVTPEIDSAEAVYEWRARGQQGGMQRFSSICVRGHADAYMVMQLFGVDPRAIAVDEPSGLIFIADAGGATRRPGTLDWLPEWLRSRLPITRQTTIANNPGAVMVLNAEPQPQLTTEQYSPR